MASTLKWQMMAICLIALTVKIEQVECSAEIMKKMTVGFAKALDECKKDLQLGDHIIQDFYNFWKEDYQLLNAEVGCAIMCMAGKSNLINSEDNRVHHTNAQEFAKSHGADDDMAKQLVTMIHECENTHEGVTDDCGRILEVAKCFRTKIHGLKWAPDMETMLEEVMIEVKN